jgi:hypothetical protein
VRGVKIDGRSLRNGPNGEDVNSNYIISSVKLLAFLGLRCEYVRTFAHQDAVLVMVSILDFGIRIRARAPFSSPRKYWDLRSGASMVAASYPPFPETWGRPRRLRGVSPLSGVCCPAGASPHPPNVEAIFLRTHLADLDAGMSPNGCFPRQLRLRSSPPGRLTDLPERRSLHRK